MAKGKSKAIKALDELCEGRKRAPSLKVLAAFINEWLPHLQATVSSTTVSTDYKHKGSRIRWPGAGRKGNKIEVRETAKPSGYPYYEHNGAETYRHNGEVVAWIAREIGHKDASSLETRWVSWMK
jgi:hypothetical protein